MKTLSSNYAAIASELSHLKSIFADLNLQYKSRNEASEILKLNNDIEDLQGEIRRIKFYMFIMLLILPIKIIVISIQSVRFAKYLKKKKTKFVRSMSRPFGAFKPEDNPVEIVITPDSESDSDERCSRTLTPKSMRSLYDELQESEMNQEQENCDK